MFLWIRRLWCGLRLRWRWYRRYHHFTGVASVGQGDDPSNAIKCRKLVLVGPPAKAKWLRFACPCRCGAVIAVNLMKSHSPCWAVELHLDQTLTLNPSVDATTCGSHFWIRRNKVEWV